MNLLGKHTFWVLWMILLQWCLAPFFRIHGIDPDFVFIFVLYLGLYGNPTQAMFYGFFMGFAVDVMRLTPFGLNSLVLTAVGFLPHLFRSRLFLSSLITQVVFVVVFSLGTGLLKSIFYLTTAEHLSTGFFQRSALHLIWSVILFLFFSRIWRKRIVLENGA